MPDSNATWNIQQYAYMFQWNEKSQREQEIESTIEIPLEQHFGNPWHSLRVFSFVQTEFLSFFLYYALLDQYLHSYNIYSSRIHGAVGSSPQNQNLNAMKLMCGTEWYMLLLFPFTVSNILIWNGTYKFWYSSIEHNSIGNTYFILKKRFFSFKFYCSFSKFFNSRGRKSEILCRNLFEKSFVLEKFGFLT